MNARLLSSLLASSSLLTFAACADDGGGEGGNPYTADFRRADEAHRARAISAAMGFDAMLAELTVGGYAMFPDDSSASCPTITRDGDETTVTGGCTLDDGTEIEGSIVFSNVRPLLGTEGYDPTKPTLITFDTFVTQSQAGPDQETFLFDGTIRREPSGAFSMDLEAHIGGLVARTTLAMTCASLCTAVEGSWVDVRDVGTAGISGAWSFDPRQPNGSIVLTGAQVLEADLKYATPECIPYSIDGEAQPNLCDRSE